MPHCNVDEELDLLKEKLGLLFNQNHIFRLS